VKNLLIVIAVLFCASASAMMRGQFMSGTATAPSGSVSSYFEGFDNSSDGSTLDSLSKWAVYMDSVDDDRMRLADGAEDYLFYDYVDSGDLNTQYLALYSSAVQTADQCGILQVRDVDQAGTGDVTAGMVFRAQTAATAPLYVVRVAMEDGGGADIKWRYCSDIETTCVAIEASAASYTITDYHYIGFAIKGSGVSTYAYFWDFDDAPPTGCPTDCPLWDGTEGAGSNWGAYTWKSAQDPTDVLGNDRSVDTGDYVGLYVWTGTSETNNRWDNWFAGDIND